MNEHTLTQKTKIVALDDSSIWVESTAQSTCGGCKAKSGCGQHWLSKLSGKPSSMRIPTDNAHEYRVGDDVLLTVPANAVVLGSFIAYGLPLLMVIFSLVVFKPWLTQEWLAIVTAIVALVVGSLLVYVWGKYRRNSYFLPSVTRLLSSN